MEEAENIVAQTAERIFADLADAQTINRDKNGGWKAPLWRALSEAGLPLSWVAEEYGGSGVTLAEGFGVLSAAGRFALPVPLAETMLAGWLLSQAKLACPEGEMTVAPAGPKDRITINTDGTLSGRARGIPFGREAKHIAVFAQDGKAKPSIALVAAAIAGSSPVSISAATATTRDVRSRTPLPIKPAPDGFDLTSLLLMGAVTAAARALAEQTPDPASTKPGPDEGGPVDAGVDARIDAAPDASPPDARRRPDAAVDAVPMLASAEAPSADAGAEVVAIGDGGSDDATQVAAVTDAGALDDATQIAVVAGDAGADATTVATGSAGSGSGTGSGSGGEWLRGRRAARLGRGLRGRRDLGRARGRWRGDHRGDPLDSVHRTSRPGHWSTGADPRSDRLRGTEWGHGRPNGWLKPMPDYQVLFGTYGRQDHQTSSTRW